MNLRKLYPLISIVLLVGRVGLLAQERLVLPRLEPIEHEFQPDYSKPGGVVIGPAMGRAFHYGGRQAVRDLLGRLHVGWEEPDYNFNFYAHSTDTLGFAWTEPYDPIKRWGVEEPGVGFRTNIDRTLMPKMAMDPVTGYLYMMPFYRINAGEPYKTGISRSTDNGETWTHYVDLGSRIGRPTEEVAWGTMTIDANQILHIAYSKDNVDIMYTRANLAGLANIDDITFTKADGSTAGDEAVSFVPSGVVFQGTIVVDRNDDPHVIFSGDGSESTFGDKTPYHIYFKSAANAWGPIPPQRLMANLENSWGMPEMVFDANNRGYYFFCDDSLGEMVFGTWEPPVDPTSAIDFGTLNATGTVYDESGASAVSLTVDNYPNIEITTDDYLYLANADVDDANDIVYLVANTNGYNSSGGGDIVVLQLLDASTYSSVAPADMDWSLMRWITDDGIAMGDFGPDVIYDPSSSKLDVFWAGTGPFSFEAQYLGAHIPLSAIDAKAQTVYLVPPEGMTDIFEGESISIYGIVKNNGTNALGPIPVSVTIENTEGDTLFSQSVLLPPMSAGTISNEIQFGTWVATGVGQNLGLILRVYYFGDEANYNDQIGLSFMVIGQAPPAAPTNLTASPFKGRVTLTWSANTELYFLRYRIYQRMASQPSFTRVDSTADYSTLDTTRTITGLQNDTTYYFVVTAVDQAYNESDYSNEVSATPFSSQPVAVADSATTMEDNSVTIYVLTNDTDLDGDTLTIASVSQGMSGVANISPDSTSLTYTPNVNFNGVDSLKYIISDGSGGSDSATVTIAVIAVNDPPGAFAILTPSQDTTIYINAENMDDTLTLAWGPAIDVEGQRVTYSLWVDNEDGGAPLDTVIRFADTTATEVAFSYGELLGRMESVGLFVAKGDFKIIASDGEATTESDSGYARHLSIDIRQAVAPPRIISIIDIPEDQGSWVTLTWEASALDASDVFDVVLYGVKIQESDTNWVSLGTVPAEQGEHYTFLSHTFGDSADVGIFWSKFVVTAYTANPDDPPWFFASRVDSGYSIDNLAPATPTGLMALVTEELAVSLAWNGPVDHDFDFFRVYRMAAVDTAAMSLVETSETSFTDTTVDGGQSYEYWLTAVDVNGNESGQSQALSVTVLGLEGAPGLPTEFALHPNYPNPFNPSTSLRFDLPQAADIRIMVYDLLGREVVQLVDSRLEAGYHKVQWYGKGAVGQDIPSGIYIARLVTPAYTKSIKMALLK